MHERPFLFPTLHVRKTGKWHREAWKACWQFPDVTRPETGSGENGDWMRKMEIGGGERGPEGLQRVSEAAGRPASRRRPVGGSHGG